MKDGVHAFRPGLQGLPHVLAVLHRPSIDSSSRQGTRAVRPCRFWFGEEVSSDVVISDVKYDSILLSQGPFRDQEILDVGITRSRLRMFEKSSIMSEGNFDEVNRFHTRQIS